ncbi:MAG: protein-L-isoaspartate O-methyltransferase [Euryarchaeota archaeon]|nr:MAG: Protein-L-isoaspartate O-methyltransferase [ANME-2 cluster archaeon]MEA1865000.1 protein-L-isoaspartate O-methyltransferase [Euryarchaeota archaeon]
MTTNDYESLRARLVSYLRRRVGTDQISEDVLQAIARVPRHLFVRENERKYAYCDHPLSIGRGQTISAPHIVGIMCTLLDIRKGSTILEIGAGSGYHAAVLAELTGRDGKVYSIERIPAISEFAQQNLLNAGYDNVAVTTGDGTLGLPEHAPYDVITVACAAPVIPQPLIDQLKRGGRMTIPVGEGMQELYLVHKNDVVSKEKSGGVVFVPLIGKYGF